MIIKFNFNLEKLFLVIQIIVKMHVIYIKNNSVYREYRIHIFLALKLNSKNIDKNILKISDQNRINIEVTLLYFSTNQLKTQKKNILVNRLIN